MIGEIVKVCWQEKVRYDWKNHSIMEGKRKGITGITTITNGWGKEALEVRDGGEEGMKIELISREGYTKII